MTRILIMVVALGVLCCPTPCRATGPTARDPEITRLQQALAEAGSNEERARLQHELGERYEKQDDLPRAAAAYHQALTLSRGFPEEERLRMAVRISWADRLSEAEIHLRALVADSPGNVAARVHLARVLGWQGRSAEAIAEADLVLAVQPENRDALQVKADALRWSGRTTEATRLYLQLLSRKDDFEPRLGLAWAQLDEGDARGADETAALLQPRYPYQKRELDRFRQRLRVATAPTLELRYSYLDDSDHNRTHRTTAAYRARVGRFDLGGRYTFVAARDPQRREDANELALWSSTRLTRTAGVGAGLGLTWVAGSLLPTWNLTGDAELFGTTARLGLGQEVLTDTAELIANKIRVKVLDLSLERNLTDRFTLAGGYGYRDYSDSNNAQSVFLAATYRLVDRDPTLRVGYRFRYLNFERQTRHGYFDPNDFFSNQLFAAVAWERAPFSTTFAPYVGFQSYRRYGSSNDEFVGGLAGSLGYRFTPWLRGDVEGAFGNSSLGTAAGYEYYQAGARLLFTF